MIITLSGTAGSGKSSAAKGVAAALKLKHYSVGDLRRKMALERGMSLQEFNKLGEKEFFTDKEADDYQRALGKKEDNFVIDGRLSFHFIPHSVKVFLDADIKKRAERIFSDQRSSENYKSIEEALKEIKARHESDKKRYKQYYNIDCFDKKHYDLVVDTTNLTIDETIGMVVAFVQKKDRIKA